MIDSRLRFVLTSECTKRVYTVTVFGETSKENFIANKGFILDEPAILQLLEKIQIKLIDGRFSLTVEDKACSYVGISLWLCEKIKNGCAIIVEDDLGNAGRFVKDEYLERIEPFGDFSNEV
jgi:hypothetical protein